MGDVVAVPVQVVAALIFMIGVVGVLTAPQHDRDVHVASS